MDKKKYDQNGTTYDFHGSQLPLAQEGTDALPQELRERGFAAIDDIASTLLHAYPNDDHDMPLEDTQHMRDLLQILHLDQEKETLGLELSSIDELGTPKALITEIATQSVIIVTIGTFSWRTIFT